MRKGQLNFDQNTTIDDIKNSGATFDILIDCIGNMSLRKMPQAFQIEPADLPEAQNDLNPT